jgi:hypothetical protein
MVDGVEFIGAHDEADAMSSTTTCRCTNPTSSAATSATAVEGA